MKSLTHFIYAESYFKTFLSQAPVAHDCTPGYSGGRDQEDHGSKPSWAHSSQDPISKKIHHKKMLVEWLNCRPWVQAPVPHTHTERKAKGIIYIQEEWCVTVIYFMPIRMARIKKSNSKCWQECGEVGALVSASRKVNWCSCYGKDLTVPQIIKHGVTMWPCCCTPR
jgi:hypothetical protein